jgi:hypothetical protein
MMRAFRHHSSLVMNKSLLSRSIIIASIFFHTLLIAPRTEAVEALLLQDTYVDNGTTGGKPPPNQSNFGAGADLRVFKGNGRVGRTFLKFSLDTLPPGTTGADITQARLRLWVNANTTAAGSISLKAVTIEWDEYKLTDGSANNLISSDLLLPDLAIGSMNNFVSIDLTPWVKAWLDKRLVNEGIVIEPGADTDFLDLSFDSKESNQTSHEARLEITLK